jgi:hypothetical protein
MKRLVLILMLALAVFTVFGCSYDVRNKQQRPVHQQRR